MLEDYTGKDSNFEMQKLVKDKKVLEKRVVQLETTHNWMQNQRQQNDFAIRSTMTNFAKRAMIEHQIKGESSKSSTSNQPYIYTQADSLAQRRLGSQDYEPVRPTISNQV